jgi:hypothetical protein
MAEYILDDNLPRVSPELRKFVEESVTRDLARDRFPIKFQMQWLREDEEAYSTVRSVARRLKDKIPSLDIASFTYGASVGRDLAHRVYWPARIAGQMERLSHKNVEAKLLGEDEDRSTHLEDCEEACYFIAEQVPAPVAEPIINYLLKVTESYTQDIDLLTSKLTEIREQNMRREMRMQPVTEQEKNLIAHMSCVEARVFPEEELDE